MNGFLNLTARRGLNHKCGKYKINQINDFHFFRFSNIFYFFVIIFMLQTEDTI